MVSSIYSEDEVLELLEKYDREFKLDTFAYTKAPTYTVADWFQKNRKKSLEEQEAKDTVLFEIVPRMHEGIGQRYGAYVRRPDGKTFYLGKWSSEEKRDRLAPQVLQQKLNKPSPDFWSFIRGDEVSENPAVTTILDPIQVWIQEELRTTFNCWDYEYDEEHGLNDVILMLDSLDQAELMMNAEKKFNIKLGDDAHYILTLQELHQTIKKNLS